MNNNRIRIILFLFVLLASRVFAFSNSDFSVDSNGWESENAGDRTVAFILNDLPVDSKNETDSDPIKPTVTVAIGELDEVCIPNYDNADIETTRRSVEEKVYNSFLQKSKDGAYAYAKGSNIPQSEIDKVMNILYADSGVKDCVITQFGKNKAFKVSMVVGNMKLDYYSIIAYKLEYGVLCMYQNNISIEEISEFKNFKDSFVVKAPGATWFNYILRNFYKTKLFWTLAIGLILGFKKKFS